MLSKHTEGENMIKNTQWIIILFVAAATAISGELRVAPFGSEFRFGLGSSAFFLMLLLFRELPYIRTGIITGLAVVIFRTFNSHLFNMEPLDLQEALLIHVSAFFYYLVFAIGMAYLPKHLPDKRLLLFGLFVIGVDVFSNVAEIHARYLILNATPLLLKEWLALFVVAAIRVYFVLGLFGGLRMGQLQAVHAEQQKRYEQMLSVSSSLYGESFYMNKMLSDIEQVTGKSYRLYQRLQEAKHPEPAKEALFVAENIHEIKKDAQRVTSGLMKLHDSHKIFSSMHISDVIHYVIRGNESYSEWLQKQILFETKVEVDFKTSQHLPLLSALNNLTANAVEAIQDKGLITIDISQEKEFTVFSVTDNGAGIKNQDIPYVFDAGFTTKYNKNGEASTGIGLSHVNNVISLFHGTIHVKNTDIEGTTFIMRLPTIQLGQEDDT